VSLVIDYTGYKSLAIARKNRILTIVLSRPEVLNACNAEMHEELSRIFVDAENDPEVDVIVITGAGRAFSAGGDILWMQQLIDNPAIEEGAVQAEAKKIIYAILECEKPIVARVPGDAIGFGATVALFCDIIVASENARFGDPHVKVGLVAGDGGAIIWPQLIGFARAREYLMLGSLITASEAARIGLINHVVPEAELDGRVNSIVQALATGAQKSIRWSKAAVNLPLRQMAHAMMDTSMAWEVLSNLSEDHQEAVNAFREKRRPKFAGR
jgi:enoyl-CoA hydratase